MMMSSTTPPTTESRQLTVDEEQKLYEESARQIAEKVRRQQLGEETNVLPPSASDDGYQLTLDEVQALLKGQIASVRARSESTRLYGSSGASSSTGRGDDAAALSKWYLERAKYIPMRLTLQERKLLRLVNSLFSTSTYIDRVDATSATVNSHAKRVNMTIAGVTATLRSLVTMFDYEAGRDSVEGNALEAIRRHQDDIRRVFEIMRRYKIMNPDKFRDSYGKLVFFMQDCSLPAVREILEFDVVAPIRTVHDVLEESGMLAALTHEQTATATMEIVNYRDETGQEEFTKEEIRKQVKSKELALELIAKSCTKDDASSSSSLSNASARSYYYYSYYQPYKNKNKSDDDDDDGGGGDDDDDGNGAPKRKPKRRLTKEDVKQCLYSVGDNASYLNSNCKPIDDMIAWLKRFFAPDPHTGGPPGGRGGRGSVAVAEDRSLEIRGGVDGSRLTHDHARQFNYVLQTLSLWREILHEVFRLWMLAEQDLLDPASPYKWRDTGQGFHRQQDAPRINKAMHGILYLVQQRLGSASWVGSSVIHINDSNVPNALVFIDKWIQVPRILNPIVQTLRHLDSPTVRKNASTVRLIEDYYGSIENAKCVVLRSFFTEGFDGSGGEDWNSAGSCVDGRLTSSWNWCQNLPDKEFFFLFRLACFTGFDGQFN